MDCIPDKDGFSYIWEKKDNNVSSAAQGIHSSQLNIYNVTPEDAGDYRCVMSNSTGVIRSNYTTITIEGNQYCLIIGQCLSVILLIVMLPEVTIEPESFVEAETCGEAVLKCTASAYGNLVVEWKKINGKLPETTEISITKSLNQRVTKMTITKAAWYHKGDYYCVAKNDAGEVNSSLVHVNITGKPAIIRQKHK